MVRRKSCGRLQAPGIGADNSFDDRRVTRSTSRSQLGNCESQAALQPVLGSRASRFVVDARKPAHRCAVAVLYLSRRPDETGIEPVVRALFTSIVIINKRVCLLSQKMDVWFAIPGSVCDADDWAVAVARREVELRGRRAAHFGPCHFLVKSVEETLIGSGGLCYNWWNLDAKPRGNSPCLSQVLSASGSKN